MTAMPPTETLAERMDRIYRVERHIFDWTRPFILPGRNRILARLAPRPGDRVLEIGTGTARNLRRLARSEPRAEYYGVDVSRLMLEVARRKCANVPAIRLALVSPASRDYLRPFGLTEPFDRILFSYCLTMLPDPAPVVEAALGALTPGGHLFIVDYHDRRGIPGPIDRLARRMMARYGVAYRPEVIATLAALSGRLTIQPICLRFACLIQYVKPDNP